MLPNQGLQRKIRHDPLQRLDGRNDLFRSLGVIQTIQRVGERFCGGLIAAEFLPQPAQGLLHGAFGLAIAAILTDSR